MLSLADGAGWAPVIMARVFDLLAIDYCLRTTHKPWAVLQLPPNPGQPCTSFVGKILWPPCIFNILAIS